MEHFIPWDSPDLEPHEILHLRTYLDGKLIGEIRVPPGEPVTVGQSAVATVVVPDTGFANRRVLFDVLDESYLLTFDARASGHVSTGGPPVRLRDLVARRVPGEGDETCFQVPLEEDSFGAIEVGGILVRFDFVAPLAPERRTRLPRRLRGGRLWNIDLGFALILGLVFLVEAPILYAVYQAGLEQEAEEIHYISAAPFDLTGDLDEDVADVAIAPVTFSFTSGS